MEDFLKILLYNDLPLNRPVNAEPATGLTSNIDVIPLEVKVTTRVAASISDDAAIDLVVWALPNETEEMSNDRRLL